mgnify:CR=1 FL=1
MTFNIRGVKIEITFLFIAFITFIISLKVPANVLITVVSSLLHEIGHLSVMFVVGNKPKTVKFEMVGMNIVRQERASISTRKEIAVSLGGPLVNFAIVFI